jgi:hypothetical protein
MLDLSRILAIVQTQSPAKAHAASIAKILLPAARSRGDASFPNRDFPPSAATSHTEIYPRNHPVVAAKSAGGGLLRSWPQTV